MLDRARAEDLAHHRAAIPRAGPLGVGRPDAAAGPIGRHVVFGAERVFIGSRRQAADGTADPFGLLPFDAAILIGAIDRADEVRIHRAPFTTDDLAFIWEAVEMGLSSKYSD